MTGEETKAVIKSVETQLELKKRECKEYEEIYDKQKEIVMKLFTVSVITILIHTILVQWLVHQKNLSLHAIGSYIQPINFIIFLGAAVFCIIRGYELFMNMDTSISNQLNEKLNRVSLSKKIAEVREDIHMLESEFDRLHASLYEMEEEQLGLGYHLEDDEENSGDLWQKDILKKGNEIM